MAGELQSFGGGQGSVIGIQTLPMVLLFVFFLCFYLNLRFIDVKQIK